MRHVVPVLKGEPFEVTYNCSEYVSHSGDFEPVRKLEGEGLNQAVTITGTLVKFKDGRVVPVAESFRTFGMALMFPTFQSRMDFLAQFEDLSVCPPMPSPSERPEHLWQWAQALPFEVDQFESVDDETHARARLNVPKNAEPAVVKGHQWALRGDGKIVPTLLLDRPIRWHGRLTEEVEALSLVQVQSKRAGLSAELLFGDDWFLPLSPGKTLTWPGRCPACNSPTKQSTFHLVCPSCGDKK